MDFIKKKITDIQTGPETLKIAVNNTLRLGAGPSNQKILCDESFLIASCGTEDDVNLNLSNIQTKLIQVTGRFCERYASDLICTFSDLEPFAHAPLSEEDKEWVIGVGIRENGVDHNEFIMSQLESSVSGIFGYPNPSSRYRKLLAIHIKDEVQKDRDMGTRKIMLVDISNNVSRMAKDDYPQYLKQCPA